MGRDVTGVRADLNKSPNAKVRPKVSVDADREVNQKLPEENKEVKDCEVKECTSEAPRAENSIEKPEVLATKSTNFDTEKLEMNAKTKDQKSSSPEKPSSGAAAAENLKIKNTPQKLSDATIDNLVCGSPVEVKTPVSPTESNLKSPTSTKKSQYYAKLEEKRKALEAEKREYEARTKEEEEAAIKQLRKNMKFKANPVPSFYYEKSPANKELKKLPTTRAISPKFGRRKSFNDAARSSSEEKTSGRALRHSVSGHLHKKCSTPTSTPKRKDSASKTVDRLTQVRETSKQTPPKMTEQTNPDIAIQS